MVFKFYSNPFSQITKGFSKGLFVVGLLLIGFGTLVWVLKEVFAFVAAAIFMLAGAACCINAGRLYFSSRKSYQNNDDISAGRSDNVRIHSEPRQ
ncbi:MAG TPA: hypothetical protein DDW84_05430 [Phycisphaerales bacterium]|nr:MAG: hypothetical protein A2Y13_10865 [Planctomycetes bacterium GWC2_45_44]HBG78275.1 hypothetical protein [Phycisphaerales bacterium]HBR18827.1 hypothetical protein [Phycisphaerales bacterium]